MNSTNVIRFVLKDIGQISSAEISLNDMTVITGKNSVSKTYITYLIFGFLQYIKQVNNHHDWQTLISKEIANSNAKVVIDLSKLESSMQIFIDNVCKNYSREAYKLLSFEPDTDVLKNFSFNTYIDNLYIDYQKPFAVNKIQVTQNIKVELSKKSGSKNLEIYMIVENNAAVEKKIFDLIGSYITKAIINYFFYQIFPTPFIVTSERTGVSLFYRELDTSRNSLIESLQQDLHGFGHNNSLVKKHIARYPLPIKANMDFIRNIFDVSKNKTTLKTGIKSFISKQISNGKYSFDKNLNQIFFVPKSSHKLKLPIHSTSSSVKSLLLFDAYINFVADSNQILIIDEPELNLHPDNQRKMARLLAMLTNAGIKVMFTTHSDYLVKELNNLIMLHELGAHHNHQISIIRHFNKEYNSGYTEDMLLKPKMIDCYTIIEDDQNFQAYKSTVDSYGINLSILDDEINNLSEISQILYTELEHGSDK